jgi:hypothetical protein
MGVNQIIRDKYASNNIIIIGDPINPVVTRLLLTQKISASMPTINKNIVPTSFSIANFDSDFNQAV